MEYSKEDLMEAKKQILGVGENMGTEESKKIWEENAQFWDDAMGDESNEFHREVVRPKVTELLSPDPSDYILDIACGNGNYSSYRVGKLFSDFMGFLIIDFPRLKRLYQMVCEVVSSVKSLRQCKSELNICRFIAAPERGHQHFPVRLVRVLDIVKGFF